MAQRVESACNMGDPGSIPELGRSSGEGNGNPLQYSCLENPMDGGAWQASVHVLFQIIFLYRLLQDSIVLCALQYVLVDYLSYI